MIRIFLIAGQSNASGRGNLLDVPVYEHNDRIFMYGNDGIYKQAVEPIDIDTNQIDPISSDDNAGAGFGMAFANRLCELYPDDQVCLVPASAGSTFITAWRRFWVRNLYGSAINRMWEAQALTGGVISGILWWQGEAESTDSAKANAWREQASNLFANMRQDLNNNILPICIARLNNLNPSGKPYWNTVRNGQNDMTMKNFAVVSTDGVAYQADKVHCQTLSYCTVGIRFADAMYPMLN